jgi:hypothetical protein
MLGGEMVNAYKILFGQPEGKRTAVNGGGDNISIIIKKYDMRVWTGFMWLQIGISDRLL